MNQGVSMQQLASRIFGSRILTIAAVVLVVPYAAWGQNPAMETPSGPAASSPAAEAIPTAATETASADARPSALRLLIGPGDELEISVYGIADLNQHVRVDSNGDVSLALVGNVPVVGLTAEEAQQLIEARYVNGGYLKDPHITVFVKEYTTQKVTVAGEVSKPGIYSLTPNHSLQDVLLGAGGLTDKAGETISITRSQDPEHPQTITISDDAIVAAQDNVEIGPGDTVVVSRAGIVYVIGEVNRAGGYVMENNGTMTVTQAIAKAAGPTGLASLKGTRVIRRTPSGLKNIDLEVNKILEAKAPDVSLKPDDIVFVPGSKSKGFLLHSGSSIFSMLTTLAIYRF
jgi:polysaccharide export outer membrane protein